MQIHCPTCQRQLPDVPANFRWRPFCSSRCQTIDLGNWLGETYRFSRPVTDDDEVNPLDDNTRQRS